MVKHYTLQHKNERHAAGTAVVVQHYENDAFSIGFAVNDNLSVSYTEENSEKKQKAKAALSNTATRTDVEMEIVTIDVHTLSVELH